MELTPPAFQFDVKLAWFILKLARNDFFHLVNVSIFTIWPVPSTEHSKPIKKLTKTTCLCIELGLVNYKSKKKAKPGEDALT